MDQHVERLPWRIAALAGLLVGAVSWYHGVEPWSLLLRVGAAFAAFALLGLLFRRIVLGGSPPRSGKLPDGKGTLLDRTVPEMTIDDLMRAEKVSQARQEDDRKP